MPREFKDIFRDLVKQVIKQKRFVGRPDLLALFKERQKGIKDWSDALYAPAMSAAGDAEGSAEEMLPSGLAADQQAKDEAVKAMQFFVGDNYLVLDRGEFDEQDNFQDIGHIFRNMDLEANEKSIIFPHYDADGKYLYLVKLEKKDGEYELHIHDARETVDEEEIEDIKNSVAESLREYGVKVFRGDHYPSLLKTEVLEANPALYRLLPVIESIHSDSGNLASICGMDVIDGEEYGAFRERLNDFLSVPENRQEAVKRIIVAATMHKEMGEVLYAHSASVVAERMGGWRKDRFDEAHGRLQTFKDKSRAESIEKNGALVDGLRALTAIKDEIRDIDRSIRAYGIDEEIAELRRLAVEFENGDGTRRSEIALQMRSNKDLIRYKIAEKNYRDAGGDAAFASSDGRDAIHFAKLQRDAFSSVKDASSKVDGSYESAVAALSALDWNDDEERQNLLMEGFERWWTSTSAIAQQEDRNERNEKGRQEIAKRLSVIELADQAFVQAKERREAWARQLSLTPDLEARDIEQTFFELEYYELEEGGRDLVYSVFGALSGKENLEEVEGYGDVAEKIDAIAATVDDEVALPDKKMPGYKKNIEELRQLMGLVSDDRIPEKWTNDYEIVGAAGEFVVETKGQKFFIRFDNGNAFLREYDNASSSFGEENPISEEESIDLLRDTKEARDQSRSSANDDGYFEQEHSDYLHNRMLKYAEMECVDSAGMKLVRGWGETHATEISEDGTLREVKGSDDENHFAMVDSDNNAVLLFRRRPDGEFEMAYPEARLELVKAETVKWNTQDMEQAATDQEISEIFKALSGLGESSRPVALRDGLAVEEVSGRYGKEYAVMRNEEHLGSLYLNRDVSTWEVEIQGSRCNPSDFHSKFIAPVEAEVAPSLPAESHSGPHIGEALKGGKSFRLNGLSLGEEYTHDPEGRAVLTSKEFSMSRMDFGPGKHDDRYYNASFSNIVFDGADIFNDANLWKANFNKCKIVGGDFRGIDKRILDSIVFKDCELVGCAFPPDFFIKESNKPGTEVVHSFLNEERTAPGASPKPLSYEKMMVARLRAGVAPAP